MASSPVPAFLSSQASVSAPRGSAAFVFSETRRVPLIPCVAAALAILGTVSVAPTALYLWDLWKTDPLKSIGSLIPLASLLLVLRAWRRLRWKAEGSWWGLALLIATVVLVRLREGAVMELILTRSWTLSLPPPSLIAVAYAAGCVLLFGGPKLLRAARFPVCLMALVNPVPHVFVRRMDLPLQYASARLARSFAHLSGATLNTGQLRLMFAPEFGMFIAPGCNGLRGAITMGLLALIAGHLYRLRLRAWAGLVLAAVGLGYVFNFLRLFALVLYYLAALRVPWLQGHAEMADYLLGAMLFFCAAVLLFEALRRSRSNNMRESSGPERSTKNGPTYWWLLPGFALRSIVFAGLIALTGFSHARTIPGIGTASAQQQIAPEQLFPATTGTFTLRRRWDETLNTGMVLYHWAEYAQSAGSQSAGGPVIALGVSPTLGAHDTLLCHVARGEDWLWHGNLQLPTASGQTTSFSASLYNDGVTQFLEATTLCAAGVCGQHTLGQPSGTPHRPGFIYSRITPQALLRQGGAKPIPVLLRAETTDVFTPADQARTRLVAELRTFVAEMDPTLLGRSPR